MLDILGIDSPYGMGVFPNPVGELGTKTTGIFMGIQGNYVSWQDRMIHRIIDILTIVSAWGPKTKQENQPLNGSWRDTIYVAGCLIDGCNGFETLINHRLDHDWYIPVLGMIF